MVFDGNLVSGRAWPDLPELMKSFIEQVNARYDEFSQYMLGGFSVN